MWVGYITNNGPLQVGIFSSSIAGPTRAEAGASFYGVMELSGNLWERIVGIACRHLAGTYTEPGLIIDRALHIVGTGVIVK